MSTVFAGVAFCWRLRSARARSPKLLPGAVLVCDELLVGAVVVVVVGLFCANVVVVIAVKRTTTQAYFMVTLRGSRADVLQCICHLIGTLLPIINSSQIVILLRI